MKPSWAFPCWIVACVALMLSGAARSDGWFTADGKLADWGVNLATQSAASQYGYGVSGNKAWSWADLEPTLASGTYGHAVADDDVPVSHGGEAFDVEAVFLAIDFDYLYFAMLTSVPPDGGRDPYRFPDWRDYDGDGDKSRRRFFPGDIALSIELPHPNNPLSMANYEFGIAVADPDPLKVSKFPSKEAGDVWYKNPNLVWIKPDSDRSANISSFSNFRTSATEPGTQVYNGADPGNTTSYWHNGISGKGDELVYDTLTHSGTYTSGGVDWAVELYYGPATQALPSGSFEGPGDGCGTDALYYPKNRGSWYDWDHSSDILMNTFIVEAKYPKALFFEQITGLTDDRYYMHWTMGCTNDALTLHCELQPIPEPFSAAFAATAFGIVVGARLRRRRKRQAK